MTNNNLPEKKHKNLWHIVKYNDFYVANLSSCICPFVLFIFFFEIFPFTIMLPPLFSQVWYQLSNKKKYFLHQLVSIIIKMMIFLTSLLHLLYIFFTFKQLLKETNEKDIFGEIFFPMSFVLFYFFISYCPKGETSCHKCSIKMRCNNDNNVKDYDDHYDIFLMF